MSCVLVFADEAGGVGSSGDGEGSASAGNSSDGAQGASAAGGSGAEASLGGESAGSTGGHGVAAGSSSAGGESGTGGESANGSGHDSSQGSSAGDLGNDYGSSSGHETSIGQKSGKETGSDHADNSSDGSVNSQAGNDESTGGFNGSKDNTKAVSPEHGEIPDKGSSVPRSGEMTGSEIGIDADADYGSIALLTSGVETGVDIAVGGSIEDTSADTIETVTSIGYPEVPEDGNSRGPPDVTGGGTPSPPTFGGGGSTNPSPTGGTDTDTSGRRVGLDTSDSGPSLVAPDLEASDVVESSNAASEFSELDNLGHSFQGRTHSRDDVHQNRGIDSYDSTPTDSGLSGRPARPGLKTDQDEALAAVENGAILPLKQALKQVTEAVLGKVIDVKMSQTSEGSVYQVKVRTPEGEIRNIAVDAKTGKILESLSY